MVSSDFHHKTPKNSELTNHNTAHAITHKSSKMELLITFFILACLTSPLLHSTTATTIANITANTRSTAASSGLVDQICEATTAGALCHAILDPANTTNLYKLSYVAFGYTYDKATSTREYIHSWLRLNANNTKPDMKEGMQYCKGYYKEAIGALQKVSKDLDKRDFERLKELATYAEERGLGCEVAFRHGYPDAFMAKENQKFINLASICVIVSVLLTSIVN